jgi:hypothetical protein
MSVVVVVVVVVAAAVAAANVMNVLCTTTTHWLWLSFRNSCTHNKYEDGIIAKGMGMPRLAPAP